ncbi:PIG-L family deacetylase [Spirochaetia bacterium 38H-sp]|uniref:PIG-L family deacetylase n=1 Tax=Rarispira pelagica TaxID=3141764 RepID=A0ABU9U8Y2_9SPIR
MLKSRNPKTGEVIRESVPDKHFKDWQGRDEKWLFISPHDDDVIIGGALLIQWALMNKVSVDVLIVTDGSMGYCTEEQRDNIKEIRRKETNAAFALLGVDEVKWLGFPDGGLRLYQGRRAAQKDEAAAIAGYVGLQNSFTYWFRKLKPTRVFIMADSDYHPDHKVAHEEAIISLFHANNQIWPELGKGRDFFPAVYELAAYCDFVSPPTIEICARTEMFNKKLKSIKAFSSQEEIIAPLVRILEDRGPYEYVREFDFKLYDPQVYKALFE